MFVLTSVENTYLTQCELDPGVSLPSLRCLRHVTRFSRRASHPSSQDWGQSRGHRQDSPPGSCYGKLCGRCVGKAAVNGHNRPKKKVWSSQPLSEAQLVNWAKGDSLRRAIGNLPTHGTSSWTMRHTAAFLALRMQQIPRAPEHGT